MHKTERDDVMTRLSQADRDHFRYLMQDVRTRTTATRAGDTVRQMLASQGHTLSPMCGLNLHLSMPVLVEEMDNAIDEAYGAAPERLYLIGVDGRVAYHGGAGPHFFDLDAWEQAIAASVRTLTTP
jgi:hypothetical protein